MQLKTCTKCKQDKPATLEFFYKNAGGKYGVTPRCKPCINADNAASHAKRLAEDPDAIRAQANARSKKHYHGNLDKCRETSRVSAKKRREDPVKGPILKAYKRADGAKLTPEQVEAVRLNQGNLCAICDAPDPTDLDHCHKTGEVRWLLCKHCNRGLGAFKDSPELLRKAADMLQARVM